MNAIRAAWSRFWGSLKRRMGLNHPGWPAPPQNQDHATYRQQYEALLPVLKGLPRGDAFEERNAFLFLSELLIGLHNYGDDPILPPGVRRLVIRENQTRMAAFGEVERPSVLGRLGLMLTGPMMPWIVGGVALLMLSGWGLGMFNGARADFWKGRAVHNREVADHNYRQWEIQRARAAERLEALTAAQQLTRQVAADLTAEREARARAAARERRRVREIQNVLTGAPEPPAWRLRDDEPAADSPTNPNGP